MHLILTHFITKALKSQIDPPTKIYQIYTNFFIYTKPNIYTPKFSNLVHVQIYIPVGNTDCCSRQSSEMTVL